MCTADFGGTGSDPPVFGSRSWRFVVVPFVSTNDNSPRSSPGRRIASARLDDLEAAIAWASSDIETWRNWTGSDHRFGSDASELWWNPVLAGGARELRRYVVRIDDEVAIGYVEAHLGGLWDRAAMLVRLVIHPDRRRSGIGGGLLDGVVAVLNDEWIDSFSLFVSVDNADAHRFYRKHGFKECLGSHDESFVQLVRMQGKTHD